MPLSNVQHIMRSVAIAIALLAIACSPKAGAAGATSQPSSALLAEPSADHHLVGKMYSVGDLKSLAAMSGLAITPDLNAGWAKQNKAAAITPDSLPHLLSSATPIAADDKSLDEWSYAPWCHATFSADGRTWSVALYLGGLGIITDDAGKRGAFRFAPPTAGDR